MSDVPTKTRRPSIEKRKIASPHSQKEFHQFRAVTLHSKTVNNHSSTKAMVKAPPFRNVARGSGSNAPTENSVTRSTLSSHFGKKFKPWRRGKSIHSKLHGENSKKASGGASLKQQLRGLQRLQQKKMSEVPSSHELPPNDDATNEQMMEVQRKIDTIQEQILISQTSVKERENARKSHKTRFVDRQRTSRAYKHLMKQLQLINSQEEVNAGMRQSIHHELYKLALDQVYIAHYPLDITSYLSIYQNGSQTRRQVMNNRLLYKMAAQRQRVLERLHASSIMNCDSNYDVKASNIRPRQMQQVQWIHPSQYERVQHLSIWSTQLEQSTFSIVVPSNEQKQVSTVADDRFQVSMEATQRLVQEQERLEQELEGSSQDAGRTKKCADDNSTNFSSDNEDESDPLALSKPNCTPAQRSLDIEDDSSSSDTNSISQTADRNHDTSDSNEGSHHGVAEEFVGEISSAADSKIAATVASLRSLAAQKVKVNSNRKTSFIDDDDDFLLDTTAVDDAVLSNVFAHAKHYVPANDDSKGDKSKGWATQKQLPGQFRKKRRR